MGLSFIGIILIQKKHDLVRLFKQLIFNTILIFQKEINPKKQF